MSKLYFLFILLALSLSQVCFAQTKGDSLRQIWENETLADTSRYKAISNYYQTNSFSQPDSVLPIIEYHYKLAESKNSVREIIRALREKAKILYIKGKPDESMLVLKQESGFRYKLL